MDKYRIVGFGLLIISIICEYFLLNFIWNVFTSNISNLNLLIIILAILGIPLAIFVALLFIAGIVAIIGGEDAIK